MYDMIAADGKQVAVAAEHHHVQLGIAQLEPGGERNGAAVRAVLGVEVEVPGRARRAADARYHRSFVPIQFALLQRLDERREYNARTAARTPDMRDAALFEIFVEWMIAVALAAAFAGFLGCIRRRNGQLFFHDAASSTIL
jgi:hypothetical protein